MAFRMIGVIMCSAVLAHAGRVLANEPRPGPAIIPQPLSLEVTNENLLLTLETLILVEPDRPDARRIASLLAEALAQQTGLRMAIIECGSTATGRAGARIDLRCGSLASGLDAEAYTLSVTPRGATLEAPGPNGLFLGTQTMRQLVTARAEGGWILPGVLIKDRPRYAWRGMLLDCSRHFMSKEFIKRCIDLLAYHKLNVFHWHLTDDQGWRIEIKKYPKLTEVGAWRGKGERRYGGFYTQDDVREIVEYARGRYVTVVPEIEMPGHSLAALASYPELSCKGEPLEVGTRWGVFEDVFCAGNDAVFEFLENVLTEVLELFPSEFIHVGGDECPKTRWQSCPKCQARIQSESLKDEDELQSYFIRRIERFLNSRGRKLIGWDEITEGGLPPRATVQSWRGFEGAITAAGAGHDVISSPTSHCYLDYAQGRYPEEPTFMGYLPLETVYAFEPTPDQLSPEQARHILGAEGNMWTEHAPPHLVDRQVFPRLCALAEVMWSPRERRDFTDFSRRLDIHYRRLDSLGVRYYVSPPRLLVDGLAATDPTFTADLELTMENPFGRGEIHYTWDGSEPSPRSPKYVQPLKLSLTARIKARTFLPNGNASVTPELLACKTVASETVRPVSRPEPLWRARHEELNHRSRADDATVIFIGDSLTEGWEDMGREVWDRHYARRRAVNLGISGDGTQHLLWRLQNGNLDGFAVSAKTSPRLAVVLIGTNNVSGDQHTAEEIAAGIIAVVKEIRSRLPKTKVLLLGMLPRDQEPSAQRDKIAEANRLASPVADGRMVHFLDIGAKFLRPDGTISTEIMPDFLHLSASGYAVWAAAMEAKVAELLGE